MSGLGEYPRHMSIAEAFDHTRGRLVPCGEAELYVEEIGRPDAPTLILTHGGMGTIEDLNPICAHLAGDFRLIGFDARCHGASSVTGGAPLRYRALADDLGRLVECLGLEAYGILGFSDGGIAALRFAAGRPVGLQALAVIGASWEMDEEDGAYGMYKGMSPALWKRFFPKSVAMWRRLHPGEDWEAFAESAIGMWLDLGDDGYPGKLVRRIAIPFLAVRGEKDRLTSIESLVRLRAMTKKVRILNIPFADHAAFEDEPGVVASIALKYLESTSLRRG